MTEVSDAVPTSAPAPPNSMPGSGALQPLHPRAVALFRLTALWRGLLVAAAAVAVEIVLELPGPTGALPTVIAVLAILVAAFLPPMQYDAWRYALRAEDLYLRHGVLFRTTSLVPHVRIQHVDTRHGPLDRWLGLASVVVFTAGTRGAMVAIPALGAARAEELRDRLAGLSGGGDAV